MANKYRIPVKFIFEGTVDVIADTQLQAIHHAKQGQGIYAHLGPIEMNSERIDGYDVDTKPDRKFGKPKTIFKGIEL